MRNIPTKYTGDSLTASEFNDIPGEEENLITDTGQTLSISNLHQMGIAAATYAARGDFYVDTGTANNYVLSSNSPMQAPIQYSDGMRVRFRILNTNTGASQINVNALGIKEIRRKDRLSPLNAGDLPANQQAELTFHADGNFFSLNDTLSDIVVPNQIWGLTMSNDVSDVLHNINITTGGGVDNLNAHLLLNTAITKKINSNWAAGTNQGGFPSSLTLTQNTWYHVFVIGKVDGTTDAGFDTSLTATNLLASASVPTPLNPFNKYIRVGSVLTDAHVSPEIIAFNHFVARSGRRMFLWKTPPNYYQLSNPGQSAVLVTLYTPLGIQTLTNLNIELIDSNSPATGTLMYVSSPYVDDIFPDVTTSNAIYTINNRGNDAPGSTAFLNVRDILTNTTSQIRYRLHSSSGLTTTVTVRIATLGWEE